MIIVCRWPGAIDHASLAVIPPDSTGLKSIYISFFPAKIGFQYKFRLHEYKDDARLHGIGGVVVMPSVEEHGFGLSEAKIISWWRNFDEEREAFSTYKNNCAKVVWRALQAGSNEKLPEKSRMMPVDLISFARELRENLLKQKPRVCLEMNVLALALSQAQHDRVFDCYTTLIGLLENVSSDVEEMFNHLEQTLIKVLGNKSSWHEKICLYVRARETLSEHVSEEVIQVIKDVLEKFGAGTINEIQRMVAHKSTSYDTKLHHGCYASSNLTRQDVVAVGARVF